MEEQSNKLTIVHFNDVYDISENPKRKQIGGVARFAHRVHQIKEEDPNAVVLFSGDLWSPSKYTSVFRGEQILPAINKCCVDAACLGNHDLDLGIEVSTSLNERCNFPWLCSNMFNSDGTSIGGTKEYTIIERPGWRIGVIGLAEFAWVSTVNCLDVSDVIFDDYIQTSHRLVDQLRNEQGCNFVIALTHMRVVNDKRYAKNAIGVDLILGGHDHIYWVEQRWDQMVVKSGCDYRCLTEMKIERQPDEKYVSKTKKSNGELTNENVEIDKEYIYITPMLTQSSNGQYEIKLYRRDITEEVQPDPELEAFVKSYDDKWDMKMKGILCKTVQQLDVRFSNIRMHESTVGNFLADLMRKETLSEVAILNSGGMRADAVFKPGYMSIGDWCEIFPYRQVIMKQEVTGEQLHQLLESSVAKYPELEGRWPSVSNIHFTFDPTKPPGNRIHKATITIDKGKLNYDQKYSVAVMQYIAQGNDGYDLFKDSTALIDEEVAPYMNDLIQKVFDYPKHKDYVEEFYLFKSRQDEINDEFFSVVVKEQLRLRKDMFDALEDFGFNYPEGLSDSSDDEDENGKKIPHNPHEHDNPLMLLRELSLERRESTGKSSVELGRLILPVLNKSNRVFNHSETKQLPNGINTGLLTEENIEQVIRGEVKLSKNCCIRLRFYKLFDGIEKGPDGENIFIFNPQLDGRISCKGPEMEPVEDNEM